MILGSNLHTAVSLMLEVEQAILERYRKMVEPLPQILAQRTRVETLQQLLKDSGS